MIGLSISPVIQGVITALITSIVGVVGVMAGIKGLRDHVSGEGDETVGIESPPRERRRSGLDVSPWPVTCLVVSIAVGASLGAMARVGDWLAPDPVRLADRWKKTGLTEAERVRHLFEQAYPPPGKVAREERSDDSTRTEEKTKDSPRISAAVGQVGLYGAKRVALCKKLTGVENPQTIERFLREESNQDIQTLVELCKGDPERLKALKNVLCQELH
jgi:hypothetical protein